MAFNIPKKGFYTSSGDGPAYRMWHVTQDVVNENKKSQTPFFFQLQRPASWEVRKHHQTLNLGHFEWRWRSVHGSESLWPQWVVGRARRWLKLAPFYSFGFICLQAFEHNIETQQKNNNAKACVWAKEQKMVFCFCFPNRCFDLPLTVLLHLKCNWGDMPELIVY